MATKVLSNSFVDIPLLSKLDETQLEESIALVEKTDDGDFQKTLLKTNEVIQRAVEELKKLKQLCQPLISKNIFENWQTVAKLPKLKEVVEYDKNFIKNNFDKLENSITLGVIKPRYSRQGVLCLFFKTIIRNYNGTLKNYNIEIVSYSSLDRCWEYRIPECGLPVSFPVISDHLKKLLKHKNAGEIVKGYIPEEEKLEWMEEDEEIRPIEDTPIRTEDGKPIVELTKEKMTTN